MDDAVFKCPLSLYQRGLQSLVTSVRPAPLASLIKDVLGVRRIVVSTPHGRFWIDPLSNLGTAVSRYGQYEPTMAQTIEKILHPGGTFIDLGANEGYFTVIGARLVGASGRVVAIEPQQRLLPVIAENLRLNEVDWARVLNVAITDAPGTVTMHLAPDMNTGSSGLLRSTKYRVPTQQVQARRLVDVLDEEFSGPVDLLKVDIEGSEYEALLGSPEVFRQHRIRAIALELHPKQIAARNKDVGDITKMLAESAYTLTDFSGNVVWIAPEGGLSR